MDNISHSKDPGECFVRLIWSMKNEAFAPTAARLFECVEDAIKRSTNTDYWWSMVEAAKRPTEQEEETVLKHRKKGDGKKGKHAKAAAKAKAGSYVVTEEQTENRKKLIERVNKARVEKGVEGEPLTLERFKDKPAGKCIWVWQGVECPRKSTCTFDHE